MSITTERTPAQALRTRITVNTLAERKAAGQKITALTAVDYPTGRLADEAGIDLLLVGDSLAMTVLGHTDTLSITMDEMLHHTRAVRRGTQHALLVADMPYGSYHTGARDAVRNAIRFLKEAGAAAVKLEGGSERAPLVQRLVQNEIPVIGHIGLTPQSVHRLGGYTVQGRSREAMEGLLADAQALERAGASAVVLEAVPRELAAAITASLTIPTIGIGAGPACDGQILVFHDLAGLTFSAPARFVRRFAAAGRELQAGLAQFRSEVLAGSFPADAESYHLPATLREESAPEASGKQPSEERSKERSAA